MRHRLARIPIFYTDFLVPFDLCGGAVQPVTLSSSHDCFSHFPEAINPPYNLQRLLGAGTIGQQVQECYNPRRLKPW